MNRQLKTKCLQVIRKRLLFKIRQKSKNIEKFQKFVMVRDKNPVELVVKERGRVKVEKISFTYGQYSHLIVIVST